MALKYDRMILPFLGSLDYSKINRKIAISQNCQATFDFLKVDRKFPKIAKEIIAISQTNRGHSTILKSTEINKIIVTEDIAIS